jgi:hypothetical protein
MFTFAWTVAGFFLGFSVPDIVCLSLKLKIPPVQRLCYGLVGSLIAYTLVTTRLQ